MDAALDALTPYLAEYAYVSLFLILSVGGFGLPIPEELILIAAGLFVAWGSTELGPTLIACAIGMVIGDGLFFAVGRHFGFSSMQWLLKRLAAPDRIEKTVLKIRKYGLLAVFFGRYLTGVRPVVFLGAGAAGIPFARFALVDGMSAIVALVVWVTIGYVYSSWIEVVLRAIVSAEEVILMVALVVVLVVLLEKALIRFGSLGERSWWVRAVRGSRIPIFLLSAAFALILAREHGRSERAWLLERHGYGIPTPVKELGLLLAVVPSLASSPDPVDIVIVALRERLTIELEGVGWVRRSAPVSPVLVDRAPELAWSHGGTRELVLWRSWFLYRGQTVWLGRFRHDPGEQAKALGRSLESVGVARSTLGPRIRAGSHGRLFAIVFRRDNTAEADGSVRP